MQKILKKVLDYSRMSPLMEKLKLFMFMSDVPSSGGKSHYIGHDQFGNKYYQIKGPNVIHCILVYTRVFV